MNARPVLILSLAAALGLSDPASLHAAVRDPAPISQCAPEYAFDLRRSEVEGRVIVSYKITTRGDVVDASIVGSTERAFNRATLAAVRSWKFTPAMRDGVAIGSAVRTTVIFTLPWLHPQKRGLAAAATRRPAVAESVYAPLP